MNKQDYYDFPYQYLDLKVDEWKFLKNIVNRHKWELLKNLLKPYNGQLILDAGCGDGRFCYELKKKNVKLVGVDQSRNGIHFAKGFNPEVEFYVQDLENINLPYKFDYVVLTEVLEHIIPEHIPMVLQNLSNVLKKDGKLIITVPSVNYQPVSDRHYQHFSKENLIKILNPYFKLVNILGYSKCNYRYTIFEILRKIGFKILPFRYRIFLIRKYFEFLDNYYKKYLATGNPDECLGLIAVCKPLK